MLRCEYVKTSPDTWYPRTAFTSLLRSLPCKLNSHTWLYMSNDCIADCRCWEPTSTLHIRTLLCCDPKQYSHQIAQNYLVKYTSLNKLVELWRTPWPEETTEMALKIWSTMDTTEWVPSSKLLKQASGTKAFPYSRTIPLDKDAQSLQHRAHTKFKEQMLRSRSSKSTDGTGTSPIWSPSSKPSLWTSPHVDLWLAPFILFSLCLIDVWYSLISCLELDWLYINLV